MNAWTKRINSGTKLIISSLATLTPSSTISLTKSSELTRMARVRQRQVMLRKFQLSPINSQMIASILQQFHGCNSESATKTEKSKTLSPAQSATPRKSQAPSKDRLSPRLRRVSRLVPLLLLARSLPACPIRLDRSRREKYHHLSLATPMTMETNGMEVACGNST